MCKYSLRCFDLDAGTIKKVFNGFWDLGDFDKQNTYLFGSIEVGHVRRRYKKNSPENCYKQYTFIFRVKINGRSMRVWKKIIYEHRRTNEQQQNEYGV